MNPVRLLDNGLHPRDMTVGLAHLLSVGTQLRRQAENEDLTDFLPSAGEEPLQGVRDLGDRLDFVKGSRAATDPPPTSGSVHAD